MSKLISGEMKIEDLSLVADAAKVLGWQVEYNVPVMFYDGPGQVCNVTVRPHGEINRYEQDIGKKYSIGFVQDAKGIVTIIHDNAMDGGATFSVESGQTDETTARVVGKMKQAIATEELRRIYSKFRASWRTYVRADGAQVHVINREG